MSAPRFTDPHKRYPAPPRLRDLDEAAVRAELRAARTVVAAARRKMPGDARECRCFDCRLNYRAIREAVWAYDDIVDAARARLAGAQRRLPLDGDGEAAGDWDRRATMGKWMGGAHPLDPRARRVDPFEGGRLAEAVDGEREDGEATWAAEAALLDATAWAQEAEDECAALRAEIARAEGERDAARAALAEEMARRLWAESYLEAASVDFRDPLALWEEDTTPAEREVWRAKGRALLDERARAATGEGA